MNSISRQSAFSLIELSIVLVILGLLVGGVLSGQSLIHASQLRKVSADINTYKAAIYSFRDKYFALPGDMTNATAFWGLAGGTGAADGTDTTCYSTAGTGTATCNGNGDGFISGTGNGSGEPPRAWQHLANAGLVAGSYAGNYAGGGANPSGYVPALSLFNGYIWLAAFMASCGPGAQFFNACYATSGSNYLFVGSYPTFGSGTAVTPGLLLSTEDAWNIDTKMDDGLPQTGVVTSTGRIITGPAQYSKFCTVGTTSTDNMYQLDSSISSGPQCALAFRVN